MAAQVQVIAPYAPLSQKELVAAYCRVSSNSEDQLHSYRAQVSHYMELIEGNPDWVLSDIYADKGITGTSIEKRDEFNRMIEDCRAGKINRIPVKSVSRFARNTTELIEVVRELRELGVMIIFEEQNLDTSDMHSEMQLALFAMAAQEESRSISGNLRLVIRKQIEKGKYIGTQVPIGYDRVNDTLIPNSDAEIVRDIFAMYNCGIGMDRIANMLNVCESSKRIWNRSSIAAVLKNEKYMGDLLAPKKYTTDTLPFQQKYNKGEKTQYYTENSHEGIVSRETFQNAQKLMKMRLTSSEKRRHLFTHRIQCPDCNQHFRAILSSGKIYWSCSKGINHISNCHPYYFSEESIKAAFLNLAGKLYTYQDQLLTPPLKLLREIAYSGQGEDKRL